MNARVRGIAKGSVLLGMIAGFVAINAPAQAGSDSPTPYTVTADGITPPAGSVFPAHGHVNWRTTSSSGGIHFDPNNNQPGGAYIGKSFLPIPLAPGECITWVQISLYDEHYGEGGQDPVCAPTTTPTEEPTWTPEPTPSEPSTTLPVPSPSPSETPKPQPQPSEPPVTPTAEPSPPATPDPTDTPTTPTPIQPGENPWPTPTSQTSNEPNATPGTTTSVTGAAKTTAPSATAGSTPYQPSTAPAPASLAVTGSNDPLVGVAAGLACVLLGAYLYLTNHRRKP